MITQTVSKIRGVKQPLLQNVPVTDSVNPVGITTKKEGMA